MSFNEDDCKGFSHISGRPGSSRTDPGTSYEVFRNNTTAVEVIIKDIINKSRKKSNDDVINEVKLNQFHTELQKLKTELDNTNQSFARARKGFQTIVREMRKQIETANVRESETQSKNLALKLENEKLRILLESKTKLVGKMKKELFSLKRVLKIVIKSLYNAPELSENVSACSEGEYEDFETDLKTNRVKFAGKHANTTDTFDSSISKDSCFDKKL